MIRGGKRVFSAVVVAIALAVLGVLATALPASATTGVDGFTVLYASRGGFAHYCQQLGTANGYTAVVCVDLVTGTDSNGDFYVEGQAEVYCQQGSTPAACSAIGVQDTLGAGGSSPYIGPNHSCGASSGNGACTSARLYTDTVPIWHTTTTGCDSNPNSNFDVWSVVTAGDVGILVPGASSYFRTTSSISTGHYYICY